MPGWLIATWEWMQASDPGWSRLRLAGSAAIAMATVLGVELGFGILMHASAAHRLIAMVLGAMVAMLGAMALTAVGVNARAKVVTAVFFPVAIGAGMVLGVAVGGRTDLMLGVFVIVTSAATLVRRFGPAFFFYGFMAWLGYFFASFLNAKLAMMPFFMEAVALSSAWVLLLSLTVLRADPARTLRRTVMAFDARARGVVRACAELLQAPPRTDSRAQRRLRRRVHGQERRLAEAALMVEGWAAEPAALPVGQSGATLRRQLIGAQQALDALVATAQTLADSGGAFCAATGRIARRLANRDDPGATRHANRLQQSIRAGHAEGPRSPTAAAARRAAYRFASAALVFVALARSARHPRADPGDAHDPATGFEPTAGLVMGNLPGSAAVARGLSARGARWNPLARLDLASRQAIQVAIAGGLALLAGRALSPRRYYWAVLAAFIMFSGTATRSETGIKGFNRILGTALGLAAAVGLAELTTGHPIAIVATIIASMFCGFYLLRVGYAYMIFFVTIMVAQLYTVFHEFTPGLLVLRLEETAIGAGIGFAVALFLVPLSTRDTVRRARHDALHALARLLDAAGRRLHAEGAENSGERGSTPAAGVDETPSLDALSRAFDDRVRRFALVTQPLTHPLAGGGNFVTVRHRLSQYVAMTTSARAIVVTLDGVNAAAIDPHLGEAVRALALAAAHLADTRPGKAGAALAEPLASADAALRNLDAAALDAHKTGHLAESLGSLLYLLKALGSAP